MKNFLQADLFALTENPFKLLDKDWMLVTAQSGERVNTMTASWGGLGILWNKPVAFVFIRPQRFTYEFVKASEKLSLSFFTDKHRAALKLCGTKSGRDCDKIKEAGLTRLDLPSGTPGFQEAKIIMDCRKMFYTDLGKGTFIEQSIPLSVYPTNDFHRLYIAEIEACWINKDYDDLNKEFI